MKCWDTLLLWRLSVYSFLTVECPHSNVHYRSIQPDKCHFPWHEKADSRAYYIYAYNVPILSGFKLEAHKRVGGIILQTHLLVPATPFHFKTPNVQSNPYIVFAANLQPSWPSRPKTKGLLLFYFLRLYNFGFYEIFVESTSSELQHPWISKISCEPKKSRKNNFQAQFWSTSNQ